MRIRGGIAVVAWERTAKTKNTHTHREKTRRGSNERTKISNTKKEKGLGLVICFFFLGTMDQPFVHPPSAFGNHILDWLRPTLPSEFGFKRI